LKLGFNTLISPFAIGTLVLFIFGFIVMLQVPKAWWSCTSKVLIFLWYIDYQTLSTLNAFEAPNVWSKINQDNQITHIAICFNH
jgi:hypothetical protein